MKNLQILQESQWKSHCIKDINGMKKLKRKSREVIKQSFQVDMKVEEGVVGAGQESPAGASSVEMLERRDDSSPDALDLRNGSYAGLPGQGEGTKGLRRAGSLDALGDPRLQSRIVVCQRPPENSYLSMSQGAYSPDSCASPRTRLGEAAGASTEIKAIQQTRRLLANARERTRVHTISAAFEALRKQVPCYSYGQKLSKLAILRIACNYILSLARLAELDYSADHSDLSFSECVEQCTRTLQSEGRSKKRKGKTKPSYWLQLSHCLGESLGFAVLGNEERRIILTQFKLCFLRLCTKGRSHVYLGVRYSIEGVGNQHCPRWTSNELSHGQFNDGPSQTMPGALVSL
ncbi:transcription factor ATOH8 [Pelodytes ibericus]